MQLTGIMKFKSTPRTKFLCMLERGCSGGKQKACKARSSPAGAHAMADGIWQVKVRLPEFPARVRREHFQKGLLVAGGDFSDEHCPVTGASVPIIRILSMMMESLAATCLLLFSDGGRHIHVRYFLACRGQITCYHPSDVCG